MRREPLQRWRLRSTRALPSAACVPANSATIRLTLLGESGSAKACAGPGCPRIDMGDGSKTEVLGFARHVRFTLRCRAACPSRSVWCRKWTSAGLANCEPCVHPTEEYWADQALTKLD